MNIKTPIVNTFNITVRCCIETLIKQSWIDILMFMLTSLNQKLIMIAALKHRVYPRLSDYPQKYVTWIWKQI